MCHCYLGHTYRIMTLSTYKYNTIEFWACWCNFQHDKQRYHPHTYVTIQLPSSHKEHIDDNLDSQPDHTMLYETYNPHLDFSIIVKLFSKK